MTWQPIETAPKDGTTIIIWGYDLPIAAAWSKFSSGWYEAVNDEYCIHEPTHWMPLPDPPKD